jgi:hypothetical protein
MISIVSSLRHYRQVCDTDSSGAVIVWNRVMAIRLSMSYVNPYVSKVSFGNTC